MLALVSSLLLAISLRGTWLGIDTVPLVFIQHSLDFIDWCFYFYLVFVAVFVVEFFFNFYLK